MPTEWTMNDTDIQLMSELTNFLPDRIFDAHAHIYDSKHYILTPDHYLSAGPQLVNIQLWQKMQGAIVGDGKLTGGLFIPMPVSPEAVDQPNRFVIEQLKNSTGSVGAVMVKPGQDPEAIRELLENSSIVAFKPYHLLADRPDTMNAEIEEYMPEWAWELADEMGLSVILHLVKAQASADAANSAYIIEKCTKYSNAKLVLAHCARAFCADTAAKGLPALRHLQNVWFDCAAICESQSIESILWEFGPEKLIWGSDYPISFQRSRAITMGDGFHWVETEDGPMCHPALAGVESLRAIKVASDNFGLNKQDIQRIFHDNAVNLFGLEIRNTNQTQELYLHAKQRMPGGVQLLSKRPEMMAPDQWPAYFSEARGCEIWDIDGKHYYDMSTNGIGACLLGYRDPDVTSAVRRRINLGAMSTLNPPEEVELADELCAIHPWAEQVRFARTGGECAAVAIRIARATTDRSAIAVCGYHGWQDWYLAANLGESDSLRGHLLPGLDPLGVPSELRDTTYTFEYENTDQLDAVISKAGNRLAAVIMEPCRYQDPNPGFLEYVRDACHACGALLIFDEITIGWRYTLGGAHRRLGVNPDMAIFAKALGNGHPMSAIIGTRPAMSGAHSSFISSTYWTESVGPAAALATLNKMKQIDVPAHVEKVGEAVTECWVKSAAKYSLPVVAGDGYPCLAHFAIKHPNANELKTLFVQLMLDRGFLAGLAIYPTLAHTPEVIGLYGKAVDEVFEILADAIAEEDITSRLKGPAAHTGFRRLL